MLLIARLGSTISLIIMLSFRLQGLPIHPCFRQSWEWSFDKATLEHSDQGEEKVSEKKGLLWKEVLVLRQKGRNAVGVEINQEILCSLAITASHCGDLLFQYSPLATSRCKATDQTQEWLDLKQHWKFMGPTLPHGGQEPRKRGEWTAIKFRGLKEFVDHIISVAGRLTRGQLKLTTECVSTYHGARQVLNDVDRSRK